MKYDFDLLVIGAGSGGVRAARTAAGFGARVAVCEDLYLGGTCVNVGCVPKKLYVYASEFASDFRNSVGFGWQVNNPTFNWETLRDNKKQEILRLNEVYEKLLDNSGVEIFNGRATIPAPNRVDVRGKQLSARHILIAVGGWPFVPDIPGREYVVDSNRIFDLESFPDRLVVVGGGYIAAEFAGIFNGLGSQVVQLYRRDLFLRGFDNEVRAFTAEEVRKKGVDLRFNADVEAVEKLSDGSLKVLLNNGDKLTADVVLYATGRRPNLEGLLGNDMSLLMTESGHIKVNDRFETSIPGIYALGDVTGGMELTPVALEEGMTLARHLFNGESCCMNYSNIATAVFCQPNIGSVGMTEEQARECYPNLEKYRSVFRPLKHTLSGSDERTLMKLLVDADSDRILGAHMVGADAGEIIQGLAIAIKAGATKSDFDQTVGIHPTAAEEFVTMRHPVGD